MRRLIHNQNLFSAIVACFLLFLPFQGLLSTRQLEPIVCVIALLLYWLVSGKVRNSLNVLQEEPLLLLLIGYCVLHAVSLIYSSNLSYAIFDLLVKLPFLILPLILAGHGFIEKKLRNLKFTFIAGCSIASLICVAIAFENYHQNKSIDSFFYVKLSKFLHPTYFTIYLNLAVLFAFDELFRKKIEVRKSKGLILASLFLNSAVIVLLSAKMALFVFLLSLISIIIVSIIEKKIQLKDYSIISAMAVLIISLIWLDLHKYNRFSQVEEVLQSPTKSLIVEDESIEENSTNARINIWKNSLELIVVHPLIGVGIGDIKDELNKVYERNGFNYGVENRLNPHNQYLHTTVSLGVIGLILLLLMLLTPLYLAFKNHDWMYVFFILIIMLNSLTESILERQAGILFFAFFNTFFYLQLKNKNTNVERT